ncbi:MAG TPA: uracil-DNA glycosylase [Candidatus Krumholzibacteria bacterium]|jgi:DNA polymerase
MSGEAVALSSVLLDLKRWARQRQRAGRKHVHFEAMSVDAAPAVLPKRAGAPSIDAAAALAILERERVVGCTRCKLHGSRKNTVFGVGNPMASLLVVGEAPGRDEDSQGEPFVGAAGQLLNKILAAIGFAREEVYIANILKCRPPNNRDPEPEEVAACLPNLLEQLEIIRPKIILALGRVAAQNLLETSAPLGRLRNKVHAYRDIPLMVTYHPAALLRNAQYKRPTWDDVQKLRELHDKLVRG